MCTYILRIVHLFQGLIVVMLCYYMDPHSDSTQTIIRFRVVEYLFPILKGVKLPYFFMD